MNTTPDALRAALEYCRDTLARIADADDVACAELAAIGLPPPGEGSKLTRAARFAIATAETALAAPVQQPAALAADIKALKAADEVKSKLAGPPLGFYLLGFADCRDAAALLASRPQPTAQTAQAQGGAE